MVREMETPSRPFRVGRSRNIEPGVATYRAYYSGCHTPFAGRWTQAQSDERPAGNKSRLPEAGVDPLLWGGGRE